MDINLFLAGVMLPCIFFYAAEGKYSRAVVTGIIMALNLLVWWV